MDLRQGDLRILNLPLGQVPTALVVAAAVPLVAGPPRLLSHLEWRMGAVWRNVFLQGGQALFLWGLVLLLCFPPRFPLTFLW
jgi:hypothetical protein